MKKSKQPGENISLKTKKSESPAVMEWINSQTNLMDSIRYLIENEVRANGVRNLQRYVPADRTAAPVAVSYPEIAPVSLPANARKEERTADDEIDEDDIETWM
ncbi:hypothetical protein ACFQI7_30635 [Paenibacillus allorhizosphaerae]|uniref:Uncharacterized protein n=1 Tax=Paenibacillus allorhizosphaerae TaxID=2849866 RepID=A0ABN7TRV6_9BACL|nr:hypothetical protein [Paenibacillus allorhizosphaerae]CAG7653306.1 hypothetical protein PAECIP111802_05456 [Paenibacillus allorhizosphaerae]